MKRLVDTEVCLGLMRYDSMLTVEKHRKQLPTNILLTLKVNKESWKLKKNELDGEFACESIRVDFYNWKNFKSGERTTLVWVGDTDRCQHLLC